MTDTKREPTRNEQIIEAIRSAGIEGLIEAEVTDDELISALSAIKRAEEAETALDAADDEQVIGSELLRILKRDFASFCWNESPVEIVHWLDGQLDDAEAQRDRLVEALTELCNVYSVEWSSGDTDQVAAWKRAAELLSSTGLDKRT